MIALVDVRPVGWVVGVVKHAIGGGWFIVEFRHHVQPQRGAQIVWWGTAAAFYAEIGDGASRLQIGRRRSGWKTPVRVLGVVPGSERTAQVH